MMHKSFEKLRHRIGSAGLAYGLHGCEGYVDYYSTSELRILNEEEIHSHQPQPVLVGELQRIPLGSTLHISVILHCVMRQVEGGLGFFEKKEHYFKCKLEPRDPIVALYKEAHHSDEVLFLEVEQAHNTVWKPVSSSE